MTETLTPEEEARKTAIRAKLEAEIRDVFAPVPDGADDAHRARVEARQGAFLDKHTTAIHTTLLARHQDTATQRQAALGAAVERLDRERLLALLWGAWHGERPAEEAAEGGTQKRGRKTRPGWPPPMEGDTDTAHRLRRAVDVFLKTLGR